MINASDASINLLLTDMQNSEIGIVLVLSDTKSFIDVLAEKSTYNDKQGMFGDGEHASYHLYPLRYSNPSIQDIDKELIHSRMNAVQNVFDRWTSLGYNKKHAKSPFSSKSFNEYLDNIEYSKSDYMLLMID